MAGTEASPLMSGSVRLPLSEVMGYEEQDSDTRVLIGRFHDCQ